VGAPYFNRMLAPLGLCLLFLMAVAPVLPWRKASGELLRERLLWPAWIGVGTLVLALALGARGLTPLIAFALAGFGGGSALRQIVLATRRQGWRGLVGRANGGMIVHLGVVLIAVAFAASSSYVKQGEFTLARGESASIAGHTVTYVGPSKVVLPTSERTQIGILIDGTGPWEPALTKFGSANSLIGTPSVSTSPVNDVMLTLLALPETEDDPVSIRVIVQPLVVWLWIGGGVMAFGTLLAAIPSRLWRRPTDPVSARLPELGGRRPGGSHDEPSTTDGSPSVPPGGPDAPEPAEPVEVGG
jgi:cytochrome c-type biogenesis protein CcmF